MKKNININLFGTLYAIDEDVNPVKRNVLVWKNETYKNLEKRNVLKVSHTQHSKATKKQSKSGCFYCFQTANK